MTIHEQQSSQTVHLGFSFKGDVNTDPYKGNGLKVFSTEENQSLVFALDE